MNRKYTITIETDKSEEDVLKNIKSNIWSIDPKAVIKVEAKKDYLSGRSGRLDWEHYLIPKNANILWVNACTLEVLFS